MQGMQAATHARESAAAADGASERIGPLAISPFTRQASGQRITHKALVGGNNEGHIGCHASQGERCHCRDKLSKRVGPLAISPLTRHAHQGQRKTHKEYQDVGDSQPAQKASKTVAARTTEKDQKRIEVKADKHKDGIEAGEIQSLHRRALDINFVVQKQRLHMHVAKTKVACAYCKKEGCMQTEAHTWLRMALLPSWLQSFHSCPCDDIIQIDILSDKRIVFLKCSLKWRTWQ